MAHGAFFCVRVTVFGAVRQYVSQKRNFYKSINSQLINYCRLFCSELLVLVEEGLPRPLSQLAVVTRLV